jgi:uncharacterized damage-inducible protein DinB
MCNLLPFLLICLPVLAAESYREEALARADVLAKKFSDLSERVPADKYGWRPADGVRSISEVLLHVAAVNYALPRVFGTQPPAGFDMRGYDKSTSDKAEITPKVKDSFVHFRAAIEKLTAADADKPVKMFGRDTTMRGAVLMSLEHLSEHLGQSIAYARSNGVVPPWSE